MIMILDLYEEFSEHYGASKEVRVPVDLKSIIFLNPTSNKEVQNIQITTNIKTSSSSYRSYYMKGTLDEVVKQINDEESSVLSIYRK